MRERERERLQLTASFEITALKFDPAATIQASNYPSSFGLSALHFRQGPSARQAVDLCPQHERTWPGGRGRRKLPVALNRDFYFSIHPMLLFGEELLLLAEPPSVDHQGHEASQPKLLMMLKCCFDKMKLKRQLLISLAAIQRSMGRLGDRLGSSEPLINHCFAFEQIQGKFNGDVVSK